MLSAGTTRGKIARVLGISAVLCLGFQGLRRPLGEELLARGIAERRAWNLEGAETWLHGARVLDPDSPEPVLEVVEMLHQRGLFEQARRLTAAWASRAGELEARPRCRLLLAEGRQLGRSAEPGAGERAAAALDEALAVADRHGFDDLSVRARLERAELHRTRTGDFVEAERLLVEALELSRTLARRDPRRRSLEAAALASAGTFHWSVTRRRRLAEREYFRPSAELYQELGHPLGTASLQGSLALVSLWKLDYAEAGRLLDEARRGYRALGSVGGAARIDVYEGALQARLENYDQALALYGRALDLGTASGDAGLAPRVLGLIAHVHLYLGEMERSLELLDAAASSQGLGAPVRRDHLVTRGNALLHLGRVDAARQAYEAAWKVDQELPGTDEGSRAVIRLMLAHTAMQAGDLEAADRILDEAEAVPIDRRGWGPTVMLLLARADLLDQEGRGRQALERLTTAAEIESRTFGLAPSHFFQTQYRQVFDRLFALLFQGVTEVDEAQALVFRLLEQMRFRSFRSLVVDLHVGTVDPPATPERTEALERIERLTASGEAGEALRRAYADYEAHTLRAVLSASDFRRVDAARPISLPALQASLPSDTALVEFVLAGERPFALVVRRDRLESVALETPVERLETRVKLFRHRLFDDGADDRWRPLAADLHRLLIEPMERQGFLDGVGRLVLVPMEPLHDLPFAALVDGEGTVLVERYALSRARSATAWARGPRPPESASETRSETVVTLGLRRAPGSSLPPLAHAVREAREVASLLGGTALLGEAAGESGLRAAAPTARRLHVAGHGVLDPRLPLSSHLQLHPGGGHDGKLTVREILDLELRAELVTLSACDTAVSRGTRRVQGLEVDRLGFVEAFLAAGARRVIAGLLPVSDRSGAELMLDVYGGIARGLEPVEALRQAQLLRSRRTGEAGHPRHWAPFAVTVQGDPWRPAVEIDSP